MSTKSNCQMVIVSIPGEESEAMARSLIEMRVAACVSVIPGAHAVYRWEEEIVEETEFLLVIKTHKECFAGLRDAILKMHPYDVPEIIVLPIINGHRDYLNWVKEAVGITEP